MSSASNLNLLHVIADIHAYNKLNEFKMKDMFKVRIWKTCRTSIQISNHEILQYISFDYVLIQKITLIYEIT